MANGTIFQRLGTSWFYTYPQKHGSGVWHSLAKIVMTQTVKCTVFNPNTPATGGPGHRFTTPAYLVFQGPRTEHDVRAFPTARDLSGRAGRFLHLFLHHVPEPHPHHAPRTRPGD